MCLVAQFQRASVPVPTRSFGNFCEETRSSEFSSVGEPVASGGFRMFFRVRTRPAALHLSLTHPAFVCGTRSIRLTHRSTQPRLARAWKHEAESVHRIAAGLCPLAVRTRLRCI